MMECLSISDISVDLILAGELYRVSYYDCTSTEATRITAYFMNLYPRIQFTWEKNPHTHPEGTFMKLTSSPKSLREPTNIVEPRSKVLGSDPFVGMGATISVGSDRHACTVSRVSDSGSTIWLTQDHSQRADNNGPGGNQTYTFNHDPEGAEYNARKYGDKWMVMNMRIPVYLGHRSEYYDPHR